MEVNPFLSSQLKTEAAKTKFQLFFCLFLKVVMVCEKHTDNNAEFSLKSFFPKIIISKHSNGATVQMISALQHFAIL